MRTVSKFLIVVAAVLSVSSCANREQASSEPPGEDTLSFAPPETSEPSPAESAAPDESAPGGSAPNAAGECTTNDVKVAGAFGKKPTITLPKDCSPPSTLQKKDLTPGTGPVVAEGSTVQTNYLLMTWSNGQVADTSWQQGRGPFAVENVGHAQVIQGWNEGMIGMKQGGRRLLIVPPDLGYGAQGQPPVGPNETLVFVIDAVQVTAGS